MSEGKEIYRLIGEAMKEVGAIGKTSRNQQQGFMYRGIDAVYNALNPVMAKYGLFICPEILDHKREERTTTKGAVLTYTILTVRYTVYAPDGSSISLTVVGEGMDSGDKSTNKAMSIAMKYAMFQLFLIPTEELKDPDAETMPPIAPRTISDKEAMALSSILGNENNVRVILNRFKVNDLKELTAAQYNEAIKLYREAKK